MSISVLICKNRVIPPFYISVYSKFKSYIKRFVSRVSVELQPEEVVCRVAALAV